jgi:hypothetical protein
MSSGFKNGCKKSGVTLAVATLLAFAMGLGFSRVTAARQQAPQGAAGATRGRGGRRGFGGFTHPVPINYGNHTGWISLFNGKNLDGWKGNPDVWHVQDGAIVGTSSPQHPTGTTNIFYTRLQPSNFMLEVQFKMIGEGANGGVQYRSQNKPPANMPNSGARGRGPARGVRGPGGRQMSAAQIAQMRATALKNRQWDMMGYQADMDYRNNYTGQMYEQGTGRGIIAWPGNVVVTFEGQKPMLVAEAATPDQVKSWVHVGGWNQYLIIADGHTMIHMINGHVTAILVDQNPKYAATKGLIGFELEGPGNIAISYRNIWLKNLPL